MASLFARHDNVITLMGWKKIAFLRGGNHGAFCSSFLSATPLAVGVVLVIVVCLENFQIYGFIQDIVSGTKEGVNQEG